MKTNLKVLCSVALIIPLFIISCRDEDSEILEEKFLEKNSHLADLLRGISLKDGSYDDIIDGASCISIELPVTVYVNGLEIEVDSPEDIQEVKDRFGEFCDDDDNLEIEFPVTVMLADFTEVMVNDLGEFEDHTNACNTDNGSDDDIECLDIEYPISASVFNLSKELINTLTISNDRDLYHFIDDLSSDVVVNLAFPITVLYDSTEWVVWDLMKLEETIDLLVDNTRCDQDHEQDNEYYFNDAACPYFVTTLDGAYQVLFETDGYIKQLYVYQDHLYAAGSFTRIGGVEAYGIAVYDGSSWKPLGSGLQDDFNTYGSGSISDLVEYQGELYVTGAFGIPGGIKSPTIARWNGDKWVEVPGLDLSVQFYLFENRSHSLEVFQGELYIGGYFAGGGELGPSPEYSLLKWDGNQLKGVALPLSEIHDLEIYKDRLFVSGGRPVGDFVIASLDGSGWKVMGVPQEEGSSYTNSSDLAAYQDKLFISFSKSWDIWDNLEGSPDLISWDGIQFQGYGYNGGYGYNEKPFTSVPGNYISDLAVFNNVLYVAGVFNNGVLGTRTNGFVTFDGQQWGVVPGGNEITEVTSITQFQNQLFMAESFNDLWRIVVWQPQ